MNDRTTTRPHGAGIDTVADANPTRTAFVRIDRSHGCDAGSASIAPNGRSGAGEREENPERA